MIILDVMNLLMTLTTKAKKISKLLFLKSLISQVMNFFDVCHSASFRYP